MPTDVQLSRLGAPDAVREALASLSTSPARAASTCLGTVLGVAAFVATLGITATAAAQISDQFDMLRATEVRVLDVGRSTAREPTFPGDTDERLARLAGVEVGGLLYQVRDRVAVETVRVLVVDGPAEQELPLFAASPGGLAATQPDLVTGRLFDDFHAQRGERVALLGIDAARRLGVTRVDHQPAAFVDGVPFAVIGIVDDVARDPALLSAVIVLETTARELFPTPAYEAAVLVNVAPGAASQVGGQVALALRPHDPDRLDVAVPPDPATLRRAVEQETRALFLLLAGVALLVGGIGIANTTLVAVLERVPEIGLRRALGARPRHIGAQILTESSLLGAIGGLVGTALGLLVVAAVAFSQTWTAVLDPLVVVVAPWVGIVTGLAAGLYPARRATRISPLQALHR